MNKPVVIISDGTAHNAGFISKALKETCNVVLLGSNISQVEKNAKEIGVDFVQCGLDDPNQISKAQEAIIKHLGSIDILIMNTDKYFEDPLELADPIKIKEIFVHNSISKILLLKQTIETMIKNQKGVVINLVQKPETKDSYKNAIHEASNLGYLHMCSGVRNELAVSGVHIVMIEYENFGENVVYTIRSIVNNNNQNLPKKITF